jgi:hypothetical protein
MSGRCFGGEDTLYERYHDEEWGFPVLGERGLFERVSLEAFNQAVVAHDPVRSGPSIPQRRGIGGNIDSMFPERFERNDL